jgi:hypothetical protein
VTAIRFPTGVTACAVEVAAATPGEELVATLGLPRPRGTVVLNGSTADLDPNLHAELAALLGRDGLAGTLVERALTTVTGGTDAGIFALLGAAMAGTTRAPIVGVVPRRRVTWPGGPPGVDRVPLEPHHTHFVLVDVDGWGDETSALLALAGALGRHAPSVAVVCGGGPVTVAETLSHVRDRRPVIVVEGSGRFADELVEAIRGGPCDEATAEIARGDVTVCPLTAGPGPFLADVLAALATG